MLCVETRMLSRTSLHNAAKSAYGDLHIGVIRKSSLHDHHRVTVVQYVRTSYRPSAEYKPE